MPKAQQEQRSSRRVPASGPVTVKVVDGMAQDASAQLRDVSMRGVFIYLSNKVRVGSTLELVLPLPQGLLPGDESWIRCKCRVVRVEEAPQHEYGVAAMIEEYEPLEEAEVPRA
jgi:hypothetical protein